MKTNPWAKTAGIALCVLGTLALLAKLPPQNTVSGSVNGREVIGQSASFTSSARFTTRGESATLQLGAQTAHVTADALELPGNRHLDIPANTRQIRLFETRNDIRVVFTPAEIQ